MLKLVSVNIEGIRHFERVVSCIESEAPDVLCLQEAPIHFQEYLQNHGFKTVFLPMLIQQMDGQEFVEGIIIASKLTFTCTHEYYHRSAESITHQKHRDPDTVSNVVVVAEISKQNVTYRVATTHMLVTPHGTSEPYQQAAVEKLLSILAAHEPHVICGDFNMPRGVNENYERILEHYTDAIPDTYESSLDASLHRLGDIKDQLDDPIFDKYMVDYIFTQEPYEAKDVRLQFGVSDHAAIVGTIYKK